jgi:hypothetical protein
VPSYYVILEREIPGFDVYVNGHALSKESNRLERLAKQIGVRPLLSFFSVSQGELTSLLDGADPADLDITSEKEQWFSAEDGLKTVRALMDHLKKTQSTDEGQLINELREFERVLAAAHEQNIGWHLGIDY